MAHGTKAISTLFLKQEPEPGKREFKQLNEVCVLNYNKALAGTFEPISGPQRTFRYDRNIPGTKKRTTKIRKVKVDFPN